MVAVGTMVALVVLVMIIVLAVMSSGLKFIAPYEQGVYMRLGRFVRILSPGLNFVTPLVSQVVRIDLRTQVLDIPRTQIATKDNRLIVAKAVVYVKVINPMKAYFQVTNYRSATEYLAQSTIKDMLGGMDLNEISSSRNVIDLRLKDKLDQAADQWGLKVDRVDLKEVHEDTPGDPLEPFASQDTARVQGRAYDIGGGPREKSGPRPWK
jgi:regulator of protease activity HflC (stomatin/prohibitin superfamily)